MVAISLVGFLLVLLATSSRGAPPPPITTPYYPSRTIIWCTSHALCISIMASSRSGSRPTEPFPSMPEAGSSSNTTTTTTTVHAPTVTTTTVHRGRPYTITSTQPSQQQTQTPTSAFSAPDHPITNARPQATTRTSFLAIPSQGSRNRPISIRRLPSSNLRAGYEDDVSNQPPSRSASGRGRSTSAPQHSQYLGVPGAANLTRQSTRQSILPTVNENPQAGTMADGAVDRDMMNETGGVGRRRSVSNAARSIVSRFSDNSRERQEPEYESEVVDLLDVLGGFPTSIATVSILTAAIQTPKSRP